MPSPTIQSRRRRPLWTSELVSSQPQLPVITVASRVTIRLTAAVLPSVESRPVRSLYEGLQGALEIQVPGGDAASRGQEMG